MKDTNLKMQVIYIMRHLVNQRGSILIILMATIVIMGILLTAAGKEWKMIVKREKEAELLFRGNAIREAIARYYITATTRGHKYPKSLDDLLIGRSSLNPKRYLRKLYKDPITNGDWKLIKDARGIRGVASKSNDEPIKKDNFPSAYKKFGGKTKYSQWVFEFNPQRIKRQPSSSKK